MNETTRMSSPPISHDTPTAASQDADPWSALGEDGAGLTVDHFITTVLSQVVLALRRSITLPYAQEFGLTVPEWRLLSLLAHAKQMPFAELVVQSTSDKALVSRTLRLLEKRGLVELRAEGNTPRKRLTCLMTPAGNVLHEQVIPLARRSQAEAIHVMTPEERVVVFRALKRVQQRAQEHTPTGVDEGDS